MRRTAYKICKASWVLASVFAINACASLPSAQAEGTPTIIAMGDMHGDYDAYESLMQASGLMDVQGNWSGGRTIFVQTGDIPDRGPSTREIIESLMQLEQQAPQDGGKVIPMVGNHEAMNMVGKLRYVHEGEFAAFVDENSEQTRETYFLAHKDKIEKKRRKKKPELSSSQIKTDWLNNTPLGRVEHQAAWAPEGYIGQWISKNKLVTKVEGYLFAHGGYSEEYTKYSLDEMNIAGHEALLTQNWSRTSILRDNVGPLWYRGNVRGRDKVKGFSKEDELNKVLETYNATHVIIGHTRNEEGIRVSQNGRLFQIDTGASAAYGGVRSFLRIEGGEFFAHAEGQTVKLEAFDK